MLCCAMQCVQLFSPAATGHNHRMSALFFPRLKQVLIEQDKQEDTVKHRVAIYDKQLSATNKSTFVSEADIDFDNSVRVRDRSDWLARL